MRIINKKILLAAFFISLLLNSSVYATDNWPIENGDTIISSFNRTIVSNNVFKKHELLIANIGNPRTMLLNGDTLYSISSGEKKVYSVSLDSKAILWEFTPPDEKDVRKIALVNGNIAVLTYEHIYMLKDEGSDKALLWQQDVGGNYISYDELNIYLASRNTLNAVDIQNGNIKWSYTLPSTAPKAEEFHSTIIPGDTKVYFSSHSLQQSVTKLYALDKSNGVVLWTTKVDFYSQQPIIKGGKIFVRSITEIFAYNADTGVYLWKKGIGSSFAPGYGFNVFSANDTTLFTRTQAGDLQAYNIANGDLLFKQPFGEGWAGKYLASSRGPMLVTNNEVILNNHKKLKFFNSSTGEPTRIVSYGDIGLEPILVTDRYLLAKSSDGTKLFVYAPPSDEQYVDPNGDGDLEQPAKPGPTDDEFIYVVEPGDTLWKIADKNNVTIKMIIDRNQLDPNDYLWVGQNLILPKPYQTHFVQSGDTLWKIAFQYKTTINAIVEINNLDPNKYLRIGQKLLIPKTPKVHIVQSGDTLWKIAQQYNTTIQAIVEKNNIDPTKYLWIGQSIIIP